MGGLSFEVSMYKYVAAVVGILVIAFGLIAFGAYFATVKANADWQKKWDAHILEDNQKTADYAEKERAKESAHAQEVAKVSEDAQKKIDSVRADSDADAKSRAGLHNDIDAISARLAKSQARVGACVTDSGKAATEAARVLAKVLKSADDRAGILANVADSAIERGLACEQSYQIISSQSEGEK